MRLQMNKPQEPVDPATFVEKPLHPKSESAPDLFEFEYWDHEWFKRPDENEGPP
jgi:hypothetical protein